MLVVLVMPVVLIVILMVGVTMRVTLLSRELLLLHFWLLLVHTNSLDGRRGGAALTTARSSILVAVLIRRVPSLVLEALFVFVTLWVALIESVSLGSLATILHSLARLFLLTLSLLLLPLVLLFLLLGLKDRLGRTGLVVRLELGLSHVRMLLLEGREFPVILLLLLLLLPLLFLLLLLILVLLLLCGSLEVGLVR